MSSSEVQFSHNHTACQLKSSFIVKGLMYLIVKTRRNSANQKFNFQKVAVMRVKISVMFFLWVGELVIATVVLFVVRWCWYRILKMPKPYSEVTEHISVENECEKTPYCICMTSD